MSLVSIEETDAQCNLNETGTLDADSFAPPSTGNDNDLCFIGSVTSGGVSESGNQKGWNWVCENGLSNTTCIAQCPSNQWVCNVSVLI